MIRGFLLSALVLGLFAASPAFAASAVYVGADEGGGGGSSYDGGATTTTTTAPQVYVPQSSARSNNKGRALAPTASKLYNAPATSSRSSSAQKTLYGTTKAKKSDGSAFDNQLAMLAEQNRQADYENMMRRSEETQARIERNQAAREARRAREEIRGSELSDSSSADADSASIQTAPARPVYVYSGGGAGSASGRTQKVFNSY